MYLGLYTEWRFAASRSGRCPWARVTHLPGERDPSRAMLITAGLTGLMARRTLLLGITAWQAHSVTMPASAAQRGAEDAYAVS